MDLFSRHSHNYSRYRPDYPDEMIRFILSCLRERKWAWDCGTGNGQLAVQLSPHIDQIIATDISKNQLKNAVPRENIEYIQSRAEEARFPPAQFDLVTVAQAIHWFNFDAFYRQVDLTLKPQGLFAVIGYGLLETPPQQGQLIRYIYKDLLGPYWKPQRKYIDDEYKSIPFPWHEINAPRFVKKVNWNADDLLGYLRTWSAVMLYESEKGVNPITSMEEELRNVWGPGRIEARFPILLRLGRKHHEEIEG